MALARRRVRGPAVQAQTGQEPKNRYGVSLFDIGATDGLRWAKDQTGGDVLAAFPRYHPRWAWWMVKIPALRELLVSNLVLVVRKR